jgi:hypothetical protein
MGITKSEYFTDEQNELATLASLVSSQENAGYSTSHKSKQLRMRRANYLWHNLPFLQHLKELKNAGLIKGNFEGVLLLPK